MATAASESTVEEDAADLVFPPEFEKADTKTLLISEVHILLEHRKQVRMYINSQVKPPVLNLIYTLMYLIGYIFVRCNYYFSYNTNPQ